MSARWLAVGLLGMLILLVGQAPGAAPPRPTSPVYPEGFVHGGGSADVVVVRIVAVADRGATNAKPPEVTLQVLEVLRGEEVDRRQAVWQPFNPFICPVGAEKAIARWKATPLPGPRIGERLIVWGSVEKTERGPRFIARASTAIQDTVSHRDWAVRTIRATAEYHAAARAKAEAEARALRQRIERWRAGASDEGLKKLARQADFVGVGKIVSGGGPSFDFRVTQILKGKKQRTYTDGSYFVGLRVPDAVSELLDRETNYLLLLSEKGLVRGVPDGYLPVPGSDGVVIADARALMVVRNALGK